MNGAFQCKAAHQPIILLRGNLPGFIRCPRPLEPVARGKTFVDQARTVALKYKSLDPVGTCAAEEKERSFFKWFQSVIQLYICCQSIYTPAQIDSATTDDHLPEGRAVFKHGAGLS